MRSLHLWQWLAILAVLILGTLTLTRVIYIPFYAQSTLLGIALVSVISFRIYKYMITRLNTKNN
ncbi:hypothetical protein ACM26V_15815 [Salipaludibacillus sp. HK11]|uniref:hypothetical protein n=1 Tax=Salipaludibacillus sp. HK11 TaxID=3394320 RepID=UPI0039FD68CE